MKKGMQIGIAVVIAAAAGLTGGYLFGNGAGSSADLPEIRLEDALEPGSFQLAQAPYYASVEEVEALLGEDAGQMIRAEIGSTQLLAGWAYFPELGQDGQVLLYFERDPSYLEEKTALRMVEFQFTHDTPEEAEAFAEKSLELADKLAEGSEPFYEMLEMGGGVLSEQGSVSREDPAAGEVTDSCSIQLFERELYDQQMEASPGEGIPLVSKWGFSSMPDSLRKIPRSE